jgi:hypothetical protein
VIPSRRAAEPKITQVFEDENGLVLEIAGEAGASYQIQSSSNLVSWTAAQPVTWEAGSGRAIVSRVAASAFYRLVKR